MFVSIVNISLLIEDIEILSKLIFFNIIIRILWYECENTCMDIFWKYISECIPLFKNIFTRNVFNQYIVSNAIQIK